MIPERYDESRPDVSWGGLFSGAFMFFGVQFLFVILGTGIGFSIFQPFASSSQGVALGAAVYFFVTMLISFFFAGYVAARFAGPSYRINSALHGVTVWAIVLALTAFTFGSSVRSLIGGSLNMAGQVAPSVQIAPVPHSQAPNSQSLTPEQRQQLQQQTEQAATAVHHAVESGSWYFFITFFLGLFVAAMGGSLGGSYFSRKTKRTAVS